MAAAVAIAVAAAPSAAHEPPRRVVSLNMCTDELVLRLAAPGQVASVTWLSHDPRNANMAQAAAALPANHGLAEQVMSHRPDLVIAGAATTRPTVQILRRAGIPVAEFGAPTGMAGVRAQIREMATLLGAPGRGAELIAAMDRRLAAVRPIDHGPRPRAVVLRPSGFTVGRGSLVDEVLAAAGLDNLAAELGIDSYGQLALESVALGQADVLVLDTAPDAPPSLAHEVLSHPVLRALADRVAIVQIPSRLWNCGGPAVVDAVERLAAARAAGP